MLRRLTLLLALCLIVPVCAGSTAVRADEVTPAQAAKEIADARDRADSAAQAYFDQQSKVDRLTTEMGQQQTSIAGLQQTVGDLQAKIGAIAVNRYVSSGSDTLSLLTGFKSIGDQVQIDALIDVINASSSDDFDRYRKMDTELQAQLAQLAGEQTDAASEQDHLAQLRQNAVAEVDHLKQVQANRLQDDAVRKALAAEEAQRTRAAMQTAAAAAGTTTTAASGGPVVTAGVGGAAASATGAGGATTAAGGANADDSGGTSGSAADAGFNPDAAGGRTGAGGIGVAPQPSGVGGLGVGGVGGDYGGPGWVCPTGTAAVSFSDTWGAPRSGGRRHEGVDLIGTRGTPVLAVVDGVAVGNENALGGTTISLTGTDGNRYYYAHLDGYVTLGSVTAGTAIGILGQTGDAIYSVPHLHFEIHPGGGPAVDPYPTTRAHCLGA